MGGPRDVRCSRCESVFTLDVPRTWARCPSCGHGFAVQRQSTRDLEESVRRWVLHDPDGHEHAYAALADLRAAIDAGELGPLGERSERDSDVAIDLTAADVELRTPGVPWKPAGAIAVAPVEEVSRVPAEAREEDETPMLARVASPAPERAPSIPPPASPAPPPAQPRGGSHWLLHVALACGALGAVAFVARSRPAPRAALPVAATTVTVAAALPEPAPSASAPRAASAPREPTVYVAETVAVVSPRAAASLDTTLHDDDAGATVAALRSDAFRALHAHDYARAQTAFEQVVARSPHDAEALVGLGDAARARGNRPDAEAAYRRATGAAPELLGAQLGLADVLWDAGEKDAARDRYRAIVAHFADAPDRARERAGAPAVSR